MTLNEILGIITLIFSLGLAAIALPLQIWKNHKDKKVQLHWTLVITSSVIYISRALFAFTNPQGIIWYIFIADLIGSFTNVTIIYQMIRYRRYRSE